MDDETIRETIQELMVRADVAIKLATVSIELQMQLAEDCDQSLDLIGAAAELVSYDPPDDVSDEKFEFERESRSRVADILTQLYFRKDS